MREPFEVIRRKQHVYEAHKIGPLYDVYREPFILAAKALTEDEFAERFVTPEDARAQQRREVIQEFRSELSRRIEYDRETCPYWREPGQQLADELSIVNHLIHEWISADAGTEAQ